MWAQLPDDLASLVLFWYKQGLRRRMMHRQLLSVTRFYRKAIDLHALSPRFRPLDLLQRSMVDAWERDVLVRLGPRLKYVATDRAIPAGLRLSWT